MKRRKIPQKVIRRMSGYYRLLRDMESRGEMAVCSGQLGAAMGCAASQVRQDFSFFGTFGITGQGYGLCQLRENVGKVLGVDRRHSAIVVGMGHIGSYMLENNVLQDCGFEVSAAFDISPAVIGNELKGIVVRDIEDLEAYLEQSPVTMAALCLPGYSAQAVADVLCAHGVCGIWNITGCSLSVPQSAVLEELSIYDSFLALSYQLSQRRGPRAEEQPARRKPEIYRLRGEDFYSQSRGLRAMGQGL